MEKSHVRTSQSRWSRWSRALPYLGLLLLAALLLALMPASRAFAADAGEMPNAGANGVSAQSGVTKQADTPALNAKSLLMKKGQSFKLKLSNASGAAWKSSNKKVAAVTKAGKVKAKKAGTATITARYQGKSYKCAVTVSGGKKKALVVYFSATGTTKAAAQKVAKASNADIVRLQPKKAYTDADLDYTSDCRANREQADDSARPAIATKIKNLSQYDTVYLGYPIWHGEEPKVIRTFLEANSLSGKTVKPFCTSGSSGISGSMAGIRQFASGATVLAGADLTDATLSEVRTWTKRG